MLLFCSIQVHLQPLKLSPRVDATALAERMAALTPGMVGCLITICHASRSCLPFVVVSIPVAVSAYLRSLRRRHLYLRPLCPCCPFSVYYRISLFFHRFPLSRVAFVLILCLAFSLLFCVILDGSLDFVMHFSSSCTPEVVHRLGTSFVLSLSVTCPCLRYFVHSVALSCS